MEYAPFQPLFCELGEEAFDGVEPESRGRREVKVEPGMTLQPFLDLGVLVEHVIVEDQVHVRDLRVAGTGIGSQEDLCSLEIAGRVPAGGVVADADPAELQ